MTDMHDEVVEAVVEHYKGDDEDIAADCLLYLASLKCLPLAIHSQIALDDMGRCTTCGCKLETYTHKEYHGEVDEPPYYETVTETYCPNCDIYTGDYYV